ncbi:hypothetical protein CYFUS_004954 [Cystobacter fuscus]|uniref:Uncharacterized protein n=1 Tax=Cystobacter fuscus TaxID=43 RepID=A0A250J7K6_9BACT|nr:hypothetical protein CYFUS_004954 [Cystobacter fuscus]
MAGDGQGLLRLRVQGRVVAAPPRAGALQGCEQHLGSVGMPVQKAPIGAETTPLPGPPALHLGDLHLAGDHGRRGQQSPRHLRRPDGLLRVLAGRPRVGRGILHLLHERSPEGQPCNGRERFDGERADVLLQHPQQGLGGRQPPAEPQRPDGLLPERRLPGTRHHLFEVLGSASHSQGEQPEAGLAPARIDGRPARPPRGLQPPPQSCLQRRKLHGHILRLQPLPHQVGRECKGREACRAHRRGLQRGSGSNHPGEDVARVALSAAQHVQQDGLPLGLQSRQPSQQRCGDILTPAQLQGPRQSLKERLIALRQPLQERFEPVGIGGAEQRGGSRTDPGHVLPLLQQRQQELGRDRMPPDNEPLQVRRQARLVILPHFGQGVVGGLQQPLPLRPEEVRLAQVFLHHVPDDGGAPGPSHRRGRHDTAPLR